MRFDRTALDFQILRGPTAGIATQACNCVGPQPGYPVCPCRMPEHTRRENERKLAEWAMQILKHGKPRIRVKAGRSITQ